MEEKKEPIITKSSIPEDQLFRAIEVNPCILELWKQFDLALD